MESSLSSTGCAVALQHDPQYFGHPRDSMDSAEHDKSHNRRPQAGPGTDVANDASDFGSIQSGVVVVNSPPNHLGCAEDCFSTDSIEKEVSSSRAPIGLSKLMLFVRRFSSLQNVHPAETFPLVLACGAVIQQIIFVAVQSTSLRSVLSNNCRAMAMITYPGTFERLGQQTRS